MNFGNEIYSILYNCLIECYDLNSIKILCMSLGIPSNVVANGIKFQEVATDLVEYVRIRGIEDSLVNQIIKDRPRHKRVQELITFVHYRDKNTLDFLPPVSDKERQELQLLKNSTPKGIVTILFSDIEGFSSFSQTRDERTVYKLLKEHNNIVRKSIKKYQGYEVKTLGDGFMVAFSTITDGILCALDIQCGFYMWNVIHPNDQIWVRIGLNCGEVIPAEGDYSGDAVNAAARIAALAKGGQILVSDIIKRLSEEKISIKFNGFGIHRLKGLEGEYALYTLDWHHRK